MKALPPKLALKFLRWFCREDYLEEIEGDLTEVYEKQIEQRPRKAKWNFIWSVAKYCRPEFLKSFKSNKSLNPLTMIRHNILITLRVFSRYKSSFFINLTGLASGLAAVLLIFIWVQDELSYDQFHQKGDRLFQVLRNIPEPDAGIATHESNSVLLPIALREELPDVEYVVATRPTPESLVSFETTNIKATGWFVGKDFFNIFTYDMLRGYPIHSLDNQFDLVISDELAINLFGSIDNSLGKSVNWDLDHFGGTYTVSGIFKKPTRHSSAAFDFLVPYRDFLNKNKMDVNWQSNPILTYLTLKSGKDPNAISKKLNDLYQLKRMEEGDNKSTMFIQRYSDRYLYGHFENGQQAGGRIEYVVLFSIIAGFILIIACINFMNLSTARASRRLKEVGIKKSLGAMRKTLAFQHLTESMIMSFIALIASMTLVVIFIPQFNLVTGKHLVLTENWHLLTGTIIITLVTGLISGSYPAIYLTGFQPLAILKGKLNASFGEIWLRNGLVVFQFCISIVLILAVSVIYLQLNFVQTKNLGYDKDNLITFDRQGNINTNLETFMNEIKNLPGVVNASSMSDNVIDIHSTSWGHSWEGQKPGYSETVFTGLNVNKNFFETLGLEISQGRPFSGELGNESSKIILNEAAITSMGMEDPIGKWIQLFGDKREIIGIVENFHYQSMYEKIKPIFILYNPKHTNKILLKIQAGSVNKTITAINEFYQRFDPGKPLDIRFLDDAYQSLYESEARIASLSKYFAIIAILISCLGLFGMAAFAAERRIKEIGIRKILGCSEIKIIQLLSKDFTTMVFTAIIISLPLGYYLAKNWLDGFAYRIDLAWWFFGGTALLALVITWITVGYQTFKTARVNPVDCIRNE